MSVGWVAAGATLVTGVMGANAASDAADAQSDASNYATQMSYQQYQDQVALAKQAGTDLTNLADQYAATATGYATNATTAIKGGISQAGTTMQDTLNKVLSLYNGEASQWEDVFGSITDNLGNFYKNLTPERLAATGLQQQQLEFQAAQQQVQKQFAQRNITGGAQQQIEAQMSAENAKARAEIRRSAELQVPQLQQSFVNDMSKVVNPYLAGQVSAQTALGQQQAATQLGLAQADANLQSTLGDIEATRVQAKADAIKTGANVSSTASANYSAALQNNALRQGQISADLAQAQNANLTNTINTGLSVFSKYYTPQTEQQQMLANQWS